VDTSDQPLVAGVGLTRSYALGTTRVPALRGVDLEIRRGEFVVVQGPSGSGKTTLLNLLGLLDRPDAGAVLVDGQSVGAAGEDELADLRRDRFGFVFQNFSLIPVLTAAENVAWPLMLRRLPALDIRERTRHLLDRVGLLSRAAHRPDLLSGGERQRVALARALANEPTVVLADEPTANLDSATAGAVVDLMHELNRERAVAFLVATHDPRIVAGADRALVLRDGRFAVAA